MKEECPIISVCMITYNHEKFISQAIEGILMQRVEVPIELIIGDDCSTDNTRMICIDYKKKYPKIVKLRFPENNQGVMKNFTDCLNSCSGEYIALCEGDDYWIDPLKLQKQFSFMQKNDTYSMCCHNSIVLYEENKLLKSFNNILIDKDLNLYEIVRSWIIPTASIFFRNNNVLPLPSWANSIYSGDLTLTLFLINSGKIHFINSYMSVYRKHNTESSVSFIAKKKNTFVNDQHIILLESFNKETNYIYNDILESQIKCKKKLTKFSKVYNKSLIFAFFLMPRLFVYKVYYRFKNRI